MPANLLLPSDPRRTIQPQGFSGRAATTTLHDATETGFQISGIFQAAEDFGNVQLFSAYDHLNHLRLKPLPVTDLSGLTLQFHMEILPVNGEECNVRPDCVRYASVGWDKLTITGSAGDIYEVPLMNHAAVVSGDYAPGSFGFSIHDRDAATLDEQLTGKPTPALTDRAYVYFRGTRWPCSSAEAIAFCGPETELTQDVGNPDAPSCDQAVWRQEDPWFWHNFFINNTTVAVGPQSGFSDAAEIAQFFANWFNNDPNANGLVTCSASGNVVTLTLEPGVNGPVVVWSNSGSAPATLTRFVPGVYTARVASSAEICEGDSAGLNIRGANDKVMKVLSVASGAFTAHFGKPHPAGAVCRVLPRAAFRARAQEPHSGRDAAGLQLAATHPCRRSVRDDSRTGEIDTEAGQPLRSTSHLRQH
ncbi:MAG: hypothetical protein NZM11_07920 [Anaerolineales bacterium]|nr:hypothetical protein [Anaerolineales bacterium]